MSRLDPTSVTGVLGMYRFHAPLYDLTRWTFLRGRGTAVGRLGLRAGESALEVGCGTRTQPAPDAAARRGDGRGARDRALASHDRARARGRSHVRRCRNVHLHQLDAAIFDLGRRFDAVLYSYSLTMIPEWRRSLESAERHLAPGGRLVVVDFGSLRGLGPLRRPLVRWLRWNHVDPERPLAETLASFFPGGAVELEHGIGDWSFIARCVKDGR